MLEFIGANTYAIFRPTTAAVPYNSGINSTVVGTFLGLPASRRASTLIGNIGHGPAIAYHGSFGTWNGGVVGGVSQYPTNGTGASHDGNGGGNILAMQKRLEVMGYDPNTMQIHNTHAYVSWWDNALLYLTFNSTTGTLGYTSYPASYGTRTIIRQITASPIPRSQNILIEKMRGISSVEQNGSGAAATFTARFTQSYPDANYTVNIGLTGRGAATSSTSNTVLAHDILRYEDRVEFKLNNATNNSDISAGLNVYVSTMR